MNTINYNWDLSTQGLKQIINRKLTETLIHLSDKRLKKCDTIGYYDKLKEEIEPILDKAEEILGDNVLCADSTTKLKEYMLSLAYFVYQERVK
jgi:hypothetical protein|tara:strand:- start:499 stop:777 length:279 start_codon:yes stop_codon:yes gene_type:complete